MVSGLKQSGMQGFAVAVYKTLLGGAFGITSGEITKITRFKQRAQRGVVDMSGGIVGVVQFGLAALQNCQGAAAQRVDSAVFGGDNVGPLLSGQIKQSARPIGSLAAGLGIPGWYK